MKIYAPVKDTNGVYASVRFVNGVGETDNPILISWFESHGYEVVDESKVSNIEDAGIETNYNRVDDSEFVEIHKVAEESNEEPDFDSMNPNELREWAIANGLGMKIKNIRNREKLLQIIRG